MKAGPTRFDNVLLVAFGGPTPEGACSCQPPCPDAAHCFVQGILGKDPQRSARVREVAEHYREIGGFSPFNDLTFHQAGALSAALKDRGITLPVRVGMRHWTPRIKDVLTQIAKAGQRRTLAVILAPHQSPVSWDWYQQVVTEGCRTLGAEAPSVDYLDIWPTHPGYIAAVAEGIRGATAGWAPSRFRSAGLVFSAHAMPLGVADKAPYARQFADTARAVAAALGRTDALLAYQSQASDAGLPWTKPDIHEVIRELAARGIRDVVVSPVGFLCDHVEVLYDLDVAARRTADGCGIGFTRAPTVGSHPAFIGMLADLITERFTVEAAA